jgi:hypothetical protein
MGLKAEIEQFAKQIKRFPAFPLTKQRLKRSILHFEILKKQADASKNGSEMSSSLFSNSVSHKANYLYYTPTPELT